MIPVFRPDHDEREVQAVREVLLSGWTGLGPKVAEFEKAFAEYIGVQFAVATNSCTSALHLALRCWAENTGPGYIITTPMSFISGTHAIMYENMFPYFGDVERDTLNLDIRSVPKEVLRSAKGILCVHFGGHACDMDTIMQVAEDYDLFVIEDVAHGCGGSHRGRKLGGLVDAGCFSFQSVKNLSCGDGGMLTTNSRAAYEEASKLRWLGIDKSTWSRKSGEYAWDYDVSELGYKYHMNDITAAIGLVQLEKLDDANNRRRQLAERYNKKLRTVHTHQPERAYATSCWHNYVIRTPERDRLFLHLKDAGIDSSVHYKPHYLYDLYKWVPGDHPVADEVWKDILTLPLYPSMTEDEQDLVINEVHKFTEMEN